MSAGFRAFAVEAAIPLMDGGYADYLQDQVGRASARIWASIFIVRVTRADDPDQRVRSLLKALAERARLGVDVRVVIGTSAQTDAIEIGNRIASAYLDQRGIPVKPYRGSRSSTHSKYVVLDHDRCIVGSHNWTHTAFTANVEDSVAVRSVGLNDQLARQFLATWAD